MLALEFLAVPLAVALLLTAIHTYLGLHVLARKIVFVDLALAQIAALGATLAFMLGHTPQSWATYGWSLLFTLVGAIVLSFSRSWTGARISQETIVGVVYVVSAAAVIVLIDQAPQGAEHLKQLLTGSILTVGSAELVKLAALYGLIALVHWLLRKPLIEISFNPTAKRRRANFWWWDFVFYALFGIVVTSSVAVAGVLLVFSFLIIPAMIGMLYSSRLGAALLIGCSAGAVASVAGLAASYLADLPTGAAMVCAFGVVLALAALAKPVVGQDVLGRRLQLARAGRLAGRGALFLLLASALWLSINPRADQPLFDTLEVAIPHLRDLFLSPAEQAMYRQSRESEIKAQQQARRLTQQERDSRWQGRGIADDEVRRMSSYTQSFLEMQKGERFVQRALRDKVRERQRWVLGIPLIMLCGAVMLSWRRSSEREPEPESAAPARRAEPGDA